MAELTNKHATLTHLNKKNSQRKMQLWALCKIMTISFSFVLYAADLFIGFQPSRLNNLKYFR